MTRPLARIDELLAMPLLTSKDAQELRKLAKRTGVDITQRRYEQLMRQRWLFDDDVKELERLARRLGEQVKIVRYQLAEQVDGWMWKPDSERIVG